MSKNFWEARRECLEALDKQRALLAEHNENLEVYRLAQASLSERVSDESADALQRAVTRETAKVNRIKADISSIERVLKERYSLAPATA